MKSMMTAQPVSDQGFDDREILEKHLTQEKTGDEEVFVKTLAEYCLLYEIPFSYLVPDETYLPQESLRFFHLDPQWVFALLDGACSIGRNTKYDLAHDKLLIHMAMKQAYTQTPDIRPSLAGKERKENMPVSVRDQGISGFLLRSRLVMDYNGLEIRGRGEGKEELPTLRLEQLSPEILFGLYAGQLSEVEIAQPKESLHLGVCLSRIRDVKTGEHMEEIRPEKESSEQKKDDGIQSSDPRVFPLETLAQTIKERLAYASGKPEDSGGVSGTEGSDGQNDTDLTSAEMALELIQNALTSTFLLE